MRLPCVLKRAIDFPTRSFAEPIRSLDSERYEPFQVRDVGTASQFSHPVANRLHYGREVSGVVQYSRAVIVPAAIQNQIFSKSGLRTRRAKLLCQVRQMTAFRSVRRKQPSFALSFSVAAVRTHDRPLGSSSYHQQSCCPAQK